MRISQQDVVLSDFLHEFPCLYDKRAPEYHQRGVTGNRWKEVANKGFPPEIFLRVKIVFTQNLRLTF